MIRRSLLRAAVVAAILVNIPNAHAQTTDAAPCPFVWNATASFGCGHGEGVIG